MKKVNKLVLKSFLGPFILTFFIADFILLMQFVWKWVDELVGKGLEWHIILELLFYASATFVPLALPLAILLSSLMSFGNLGERYELVSMKAAGISLRKIMRPLVFVAIFISVSAFYFSNYILPVANLKFRSILYDVRQQKLAFNIKEGIYYNGLDGYTIRVEKKEKDEQTIRGVMIYDHTKKMGNTNLTIADSGRMEITADESYLVFTLFNGVNYYEEIDRKNLEKRPFRRTTFKESKRMFDLSAFALTRTNEDLFKKNYQMLNLQQLDDAVDSIDIQISRRQEDYHKTFISNYFYLSKKIDSTNSIQIDSAILYKPDFLSNFSKGDKAKIIDIALNAARSTKSNIEYQKNYIINKKKLVIKHRIEWQRKFTLSFACIILFFIGAPLGAIIRKGGLGLPLVVSVILFVIYHIFSTTGFKYAREGVLSPFEGMWLASAVFLPIGVFLTIKATSDSPLFDIDAWKKPIGKLISFIKNKR